MKLPERITVGKVSGRAVRARLLDGTVVTRRDDDIIVMTLDGIPKNYRTAEYDNHFIFTVPDKASRDLYPWSPICSCGGMAGLSGYNAYKKDASPSRGDKDAGLVPGELVVCLLHANTGRHADGSK